MHPRIERFKRAMLKLATKHPQFLIPYLKLQHKVTADDSLPTAGVDTNGKITLGTTCDTISLEALGWRGAHELLHVVLMHHARLGGRDMQRANVAMDMVINTTCRDMDPTAERPATWMYLPAEYNGPRTFEDVYAWLTKQAEQGNDRAKDASGEDGAGCGVDPAPSAGAEGADGESGQSGLDGVEIAQLGADMAAADDALSKAKGRKAGTGSAPLALLLKPVPPKAKFRDVLRAGTQRTVNAAQRDVRTYGRLSRRPGMGTLRPGLVNETVRIAVVIDVSSSVSRQSLVQVVAEIKALLKLQPGLRVFLVAHTSEVVWRGWVQSDTAASVDAAVQFSGGTRAAPAYVAVRAAGQFDALIHFTDCELESEWPAVPAKRLIVGKVGSWTHTTPVPVGAQVIPVAA